jgi:hypothetical protein
VQGDVFITLCPRARGAPSPRLIRFGAFAYQSAHLYQGCFCDTHMQVNMWAILNYLNYSVVSRYDPSEGQGREMRRMDVRCTKVGKIQQTGVNSHRIF